jgi:hypothetical protein
MIGRAGIAVCEVVSQISLAERRAVPCRVVSAAAADLSRIRAAGPGSWATTVTAVIPSQT